MLLLSELGGWYACDNNACESSRQFVESHSYPHYLVPTFFRYVIGLAAFSTLANSVPVCHAGSAGVLRLTTAVRRSQQARFAVR